MLKGSHNLNAPRRRSACVIVGLSMTTACGEAPTDPPAEGGADPTLTYTLEPRTATIGLGFSEEFRVVVTDSTGRPMGSAETVLWQPGNDEVATVQDGGVVKAHGPGTTEIGVFVPGVPDSPALHAEVTVPILRFKQVAAAGTYTCAVTVEDVPYCWGYNDVGQLGDGTRNSRFQPTPVVGRPRFERVTARSDHSCGLTPEGVAMCWGWNVAGRLGILGAENEFRLRPSLVLGGVRFVAVHAGSWMTCGLTEDGSGYCWGRNERGQVGDGTLVGRPTAVPVSGEYVFAMITTGAQHTCGIDPAGLGFCWGLNELGQLGDGTLTNRAVPTPVSGDFRWRSLSAGTGHSCGVTLAGEAYCWGTHRRGRLGTGTEEDHVTPARVATDVKFREVTTGTSFSCALSEEGDAYCWGRNFSGAVGQPYPAVVDAYTPLPVVGGLRFESIDSGGSHTCGIATDGLLYCWGANPFGQFGVGEYYVRRHIPAPVFGQR